MSSIDSSRGNIGRPSPARHGDKTFLRAVILFSRIVTAIFLAALAWALFQAVANDNPLPVWAWLGVVTLFAVALGLGVAALVYRGVRQQAGPFDFRPSRQVNGALVLERQSVAIDGATALQVDIRMAQGMLRLARGASEAMDADFTYDNADWRNPEVTYVIDAAGQGHLAVKQVGTHRPAMRQGRAEWDIRLPQDLPVDLSVHFGAGKANLLLGGIALERLRVESGVGELLVDLSGEWLRSLQVFVKAGIGDTVLRLPRGAGVRVQPNVGLGSLQAGSLIWDGTAYTNALYGQAPVTLDITVDGGMGRIELVPAGSGDGPSGCGACRRRSDR